MVSVFRCNKNSSSYVLDDTHSEIIVFNASNMVHMFNQALNVPDSGEVYICLTEIDDDAKIVKTQDQLKEYLKYKKELAFISNTVIDAMIMDNDFLGYVQVSNPTSNSNSNLIIDMASYVVSSGVPAYFSVKIAIFF